MKRGKPTLGNFVLTPVRTNTIDHVWRLSPRFSGTVEKRLGRWGNLTINVDHSGPTLIGMSLNYSVWPEGVDFDMILTLRDIMQDITKAMIYTTYVWEEWNKVEIEKGKKE